MWRRLSIGWLKWKLVRVHARYRPTRSAVLSRVRGSEYLSAERAGIGLEINRLLDQLARLEPATPTTRIDV